jgi:hypothetical protein
MSRKKISLALLMLASLGLNAAGASACAAGRTRNAANAANESDQSKSKAQTPEPTPARVLGGEDRLEEKASSEIRELAAGGYGPVREPFIFVARDVETYARLRELNDKLPELGADFFKSNAVVAAFLGSSARPAACCASRSRLRRKAR